jgi:hypothetical protein
MSHGFYNGTYGRWFGEHRSVGIDTLRARRPDLHCWVTSTSWSKMDANNMKEMHGNIYTAKVNSITPWAGIQRPAQWVGGDPNPGSAFSVAEDGSYEVRRGYYYYKQVCRAGQPGMAVARTSVMDSEIALIGFSRNGTRHPDALVMVNIAKQDQKVRIKVRGCASKVFAGTRTTDDKDRCKDLGTVELNDADELICTAPARSTTTFIAQ